VLSPALLDANRRNAKKSTGPRTRRGKAQSRMNSLRTGARSRLYQDLMWKLMDAPPCGLGRTLREALTPEQAVHPLFAELVWIFCQAEMGVSQYLRLILPEEDL
jgi:hypothetical protein